MKHNRTTMILVRAVIICAIFGLTSANPHGSRSSAEVSLVKAVWETAQFSTSWNPAPYTYLSWKYRGTLPIITVNASVNSTDPSYADRITLFDDGSLELRNLTLDDCGDYAVKITSTEDPELTGVFSLSVLEPVSNVTLLLSANATDLIEAKLLTLTCSASGSDLRFSFYNGSSIMSDDSDSEHGWSVSRYDTGPFRCEAYNSINKVSSEEVHVTVSYGPYVGLKVVPSKDTYAVGSSVTLVCTIDSKPEAEGYWWYHPGFNDEPLLLKDLTATKREDYRRNRKTDRDSTVSKNIPEYKYVLKDLTLEDKGFYSCDAYNHKTNEYRSEGKYISVEYGLSVITLVGIALGCVAFAAGFAGGLACVYHRKKMRERAR